MDQQIMQIGIGIQWWNDEWIYLNSAGIGLWEHFVDDAFVNKITKIDEKLFKGFNGYEN